MGSSPSSRIRTVQLQPKPRHGSTSSFLFLTSPIAAHCSVWTNWSLFICYEAERQWKLFHTSLETMKVHLPSFFARDLHSDDYSLLDRVVDLKGGPSTTAQLNEYVKTADDFRSPSRPYSSPNPGDRGTGSLSPSRAKYAFIFHPLLIVTKNLENTNRCLRENWTESCDPIPQI